MSRSAYSSELGRFLKARRADLCPQQVGLPETRNRRVPGLRREEVAQLVAISTNYYARLEQGRLTPSAPVLDALTRALQLDDDQRSYLAELAGKHAPQPHRHQQQTAQPALLRLLNDMRATAGIVLGRGMDILAWNPLAAALITDFAKIPKKQRNYLRLVFADAAMRSLYSDWEGIARTCVALVRREAAHYPDDPRLTALVSELSAQDPQFRQWWSAHHIAGKRLGTKDLHHPLVGDLCLDWEALTCASDPDQQLIVLSAQERTLSERRLCHLSSLVRDRA